MGRVRGARAAVLAAGICAATLAACGGGGANSEAARTHGVRLQRVASFEAPLYATSAPGDARRLFVVEQAGQIQILRDGRRNRDAFLDIRPLVRSGGEQGLLSVAFPPDYGRTGRFYVYYTTKAGNQRIVEYHRRDAAHADRRSARTVLEMADHEANHNGGQLRFGPDGLLYVGTGDGGGGG